MWESCVVIKLSQFLIKAKITTAVMYSLKNVQINYLKNNDKTFFDSLIILRFGKTNSSHRKTMVQEKH